MNTPSTPQPQLTTSVRRVLPLFVRRAIPLFLLILVGAALLGMERRAELINRIKADETLHVELARSVLESYLQGPLVHLQSLARDEHIVQDVINAKPGTTPQTLHVPFGSLLSRNHHYAQIRWIGDDGRERARIDRLSNGQIRIVPAAELQDKSQRDYVKEALRLGPGAIFVSPLDLNIEQGKVEIPYRPMIRLSMRMFRADGTSNGLLVLNLAAEKMLKIFASYLGGSDIVLLNTDGYWLYSTRHEDEWGFMFQQPETFGSRHTAAWQRINAIDIGQAEMPGGLWTWATVHVTPSGAVNSKPMAWKVVAQVSGDRLAAINHAAWTPIIGVALVLMALFGYGSWRLAAASERQIADNRELTAAKAALEHHQEHLEEQVVVRTLDLAASRDEAEGANRAKIELLANMSHELRTPLNHILGINSILTREIATDKGREFLEKQRHAANNLRHLIDNLLDTAKLEADQLHIEARDFKLAGLLDQVEMAARGVLDAKGLQLVREVDAGLPDELNGDNERLAQVLGELLDNAIKFSTAGPITLRVKQAGSQGHRITLRCEIEDKGIGIPPERQAAIFNLFVQADGSSTRKYGGTGLGLALCYRIVGLMAGKIGFESAPDQGSLFWIEIPLNRGTPAAPPVGAANPPDSLSGRQQLGELHELLKSGDFQVQVRWREMKAEAGYLLGDDLPAFEATMAGFDFDAAAGMLDRHACLWAAPTNPTPPCADGSPSSSPPAAPRFS